MKNDNIASVNINKISLENNLLGQFINNSNNPSVYNNHNTVDTRDNDDPNRNTYDKALDPESKIIITEVDTNKPEKAIKKKVTIARKPKMDIQEPSQTNALPDNNKKIQIEHTDKPSPGLAINKEEQQTNPRKKAGFTFAGMYNFLNYADPNSSSKLDVSNRIKNYPIFPSNKSDITTESTRKNTVINQPIFGKVSTSGNPVSLKPSQNNNLSDTMTIRGAKIETSQKVDLPTTLKNEEVKIENPFLKKSESLKNTSTGIQIDLNLLKKENALLNTFMIPVAKTGLAGTHEQSQSVSRKRKEPSRRLEYMNIDDNEDELSYSLKKIRISDNREDEHPPIKIEIDEEELPNPRDMWGKIKDNFITTLNGVKSVINGISSGLFSSQHPLNTTQRKPRRSFRDSDFK